ncbi:potential Auxin Efflux Carrier protein [Uncinocarpus reesii 1704]|uniref:Potential Auxin Efflux Carrier protein n=1 Tax=Uncinocarpus reesii (strain UAMH 1704) TaxID=336963 RepID=C4JIC7_UNCRE|nr:putative Auxin Efflux Carrier protein [Uncinocarpus reesii 1704]EEP78024.1 potential Auxin Efflux Carrier protein [Uncinocarpus reesii 1704]
MPFLASPRSFRTANLESYSHVPFNQLNETLLAALAQDSQHLLQNGAPAPHGSHPPLPHLALLVFEAVLEVVCVSLPGYIVARLGMFDANAQKFVANLNVMLFTPCLIFTKLASQLTAGKLADLAIIPFIFLAQTIVSWLSAKLVSRIFRFKKRPSNFVTAMGVFGNSNSLPISLVMSLSRTIQGLHWDRVPGDTDDEVAARGILYLMVFQQLGQLLRWSWGYRVLLAPREQYYRDEEERANSRIQNAQDRYSDHPEDESDPTLIGDASSHSEGSHFASGDQTPVSETSRSYVKLPQSNRIEIPENTAPLPLDPPLHDRFQGSPGHLAFFPNVEPLEDPSKLGAAKSRLRTCKQAVSSAIHRFHAFVKVRTSRAFAALPLPLQKACKWASHKAYRFLHGVWEFMNPPLWAMLAAIIVASIPSLQRLFFTKGTFVHNSITSAITQSSGVAVPLILVVLGANLERNTLPEEAHHDHEDPREERNLIIASVLARMLLPVLIMGPVLALTAKYVPVSILDDPIFVIVCFLLTGAPSALQLAQICQINNVYMGAMAKLLFQSYVVWILPSTLILVMSALEVVEWATTS